jgi:putative transposase
LAVHIGRIHEENYGVYGVRKVWRQLRREGIDVGRDQVGRIMAGLGLRGATRGKYKRTTIAGDLSARPADLVDRQFTASAPNRLWLADMERHEALLNREEVKDLLLQPVAAGW